MEYLEATASLTCEGVSLYLEVWGKDIIGGLCRGAIKAPIYSHDTCSSTPETREELALYIVFGPANRLFVHASLAYMSLYILPPTLFHNAVTYLIIMKTACETNVQTAILPWCFAI
jgi:hypothetical protein